MKLSLASRPRKSFERMWDNKENPRDIIENEGMKQISDVDELNKIVDNIIKNNYKSVEEYQSGKDKLLRFLCWSSYEGNKRPRESENRKSTA